MSDERIEAVDLATVLRVIPTRRLMEWYKPADSIKRWWTWAHEAAEIMVRICLCCGQRGHYQWMLEEHIRKHGLDGMGICIMNGRVHDGHHRVVAAIHLDIPEVPLETWAEAEARYLRDHGDVDWNDRVVGDVHPRAEGAYR